MFTAYADLILPSTVRGSFPPAGLTSTCWVAGFDTASRRPSSESSWDALGRDSDQDAPASTSLSHETFTSMRLAGRACTIPVQRWAGF